jgi:sodium-dependent dicarboxylate transporter 2/3/5
MTTLGTRSLTNAIRPVGIAAAVLALVLPWLVDFPGLGDAGSRMFGIFLMAIVLWVTEAIPLHATAALIVLLEILMVSDKAFGSASIPDPPAYSTFFAAFASPVIMLFLGGFFLAETAAKFGFDRYLAKVMLRPFGTSPKLIMLGLMVITAGLSMFMSNTATTATLMAVVIPVIAGLPAGDRLKTGLALSIPVAANIGGMGTPVGTPPNAIAVGSLADAGYSVSFLQWMIVSVPIMLVLLFGAWWLLGRFYRGTSDRIDIDIEATFDRSRSAMIFYATFAITVLLWLTEPIHGISSNIVGFLPVVILLATRVFTARDMQSIQWDVLWLVAGGIALGIGVGTSGLDAWLVGRINWDVIDPAMIIVVLALATVALSTVISNSAATNLLMPIGLSLAISGGLGLSPVLAAFFIAIAASSAMALPVSTPPNAIAYSTGAVSTKSMATVGIAVGAVSLVLFLLIAPTIWGILGLS